MTIVILSDGEQVPPNAGIQELGPAILMPSQAVGNVVARSNHLIAGHREWLNSLPRDAPSITPAPILDRRQAAILPECSGFVASASASASNLGFASASAQFAISFSSVSSTAAATIASQSAALQSASIALTSATSALSSANSLAVAASSSAKSIQSSAASAISMAQASVQSAIISAQSSANVVVQSANSVANNAMATATFAIAQAQASISGINAQAQSRILVSMNNLKFALILTFSILGSSIITILVIYLLLRLRRRRQDRKERKREEFKEKIEVKRGSDNSGMPSLSEFPMPANRKYWNGARSSERGRDSESRGRPSSEAVPSPRWDKTYNGPRRSVEFPFPGASDSRKTWSQDRTAVAGGEALNGKPKQRRMTEGQVERSRSLRTLTYDADYPDQPPRFGSWLGDLRKNDDPLEIKKGSRNRDRRRPAREEDEASEIGTAY